MRLCPYKLGSEEATGEEDPTPLLIAPRWAVNFGAGFGGAGLRTSGQKQSSQGLVVN